MRSVLVVIVVELFTLGLVRELHSSESRDCEQFDDNCQGPTQENDIPADENYSNETSSDENIIDKTSSDQNLFDGTPSDEKVHVGTPPDEKVHAGTPPGEKVHAGTPPDEKVHEGTPPGEKVHERTPPDEKVHEGTPPGEKVHAGTPPDEKVHEGTPPDEKVHEGTPPGEKVHAGTPPDEKVHERTPPDEKVHEGTPPGEKVHAGTPPDEKVHEGTPPDEKVHEGTPPGEKVHAGTPPDEKVHAGTPPDEKVHEGTPPGEKVHAGTPPDEKVHERTPPDEKVHEGTPPGEKVHAGTPPDEKVHEGTPPDEKVHVGTPPHEKAHEGTPQDEKVHEGTPSDEKVHEGTLPDEKFHEGTPQDEKVHERWDTPENDNKDESPADPIRCPVGQYSGLYNLCQECPGMNEMCFTQNCCSPNTDLFCSSDGYCRCRPDQRDYCGLASPDESKGLMNAAKIALIVALVVAIAVAVGLLWKICRRRRLDPAWSSQGVDSRSNSLNSLQRFVLTRLRDRPPMYDDDTYIALEKPPPYHVVMAENILSGAAPPWANQQVPYEGTTNAAFTAGNETNELSLSRNSMEEEHLHYLPHNTGNNSRHQVDRETNPGSALSEPFFDPRPRPPTIQSHLKVFFIDDSNLPSYSEACQQVDLNSSCTRIRERIIINGVIYSPPTQQTQGLNDGVCENDICSEGERLAIESEVSNKQKENCIDVTGRDVSMVLDHSPTESQL